MFFIHDPKKRAIDAPSFRDRVIHHALMNVADPVIDKTLVDSTFACRKGKGPLKAVAWVQMNVRKYPWFVKIDIRKYFDSIDHQILKNLLKRKIKGYRTLDLMERIICSYHTACGKGLPIGSLTSQYFANYYLNTVDRLILGLKGVMAHARYMDDIVWWCEDKESAKQTYVYVKKFISRTLLLEIKENYQINRSMNGLTFCGFRVFANRLDLTRRKKVRYVKRLAYWENAFSHGLIDETKLQSAYSSVHSIVSNAESKEWRKRFFQQWIRLDV